MIGNQPLQETVVATAALRNLREALPVTWSVGSSSSAYARGTAGYIPDIDMQIASPGARTIFAGEVFVGPMSREKLQLRIAEGREALGDISLLFIVPFAGPALREVCESNGVSYLDETGWVYLRDDRAGIFVSREGAHKSPIGSRQHSGMRRLNGPGASAVIRALWDAELPVGVRALAQHAGVSAGTSAKILPELAEYGAVERSSRGEILAVDRSLLLDRWAYDYGIFTSNKEVRWFLAPRGVTDVYTQVSKLQSEDDALNIAYTGYAAAVGALPQGEHAVIPDALVAAYTVDPGALAAALHLKPVPRALANIVLVRPRDGNILRKRESDFHVALPQALVDLLTMGGRFPELAEQILRYGKIQD